MLNFRKTYLLAEFWPPVYFKPFLGIIWLFLCLAGLFWVNPTISGLFCVNRSGFPFSRPAFPPLSGCLASLLTTPSSPPSSRTLPAPMLAVSTRWGWGAGEKKTFKTLSGGEKTFKNFRWTLSSQWWLLVRRYLNRTEIQISTQRSPYFRQACLAHHQIVIWICIWLYLTSSTNLQMVRQQCCLI